MSEKEFIVIFNNKRIGKAKSIDVSHGGVSHAGYVELKGTLEVEERVTTKDNPDTQ